MLTGGLGFSKSTKNSICCSFREVFATEIRLLERGARLAVRPCCAATRGPSRDAGGTHRRQRTADDCLCGRYEARQARNRELFAELQAKGPDGYSQQHNTDALEHGHFAPFALKMLGMSSKSGICPGVNFRAPGGMSSLKASGATSPAAFHALTSRVYCGDPLTFLLVMT
jgi:hypothetical protein